MKMDVDLMPGLLLEERDATTHFPALAGAIIFGLGRLLPTSEGNQYLFQHFPARAAQQCSRRGPTTCLCWPAGAGVCTRSWTACVHA